MTQLNLSVAQISVGSESQGSGNQASTEILISVTSSTGVPFAGLTHDDFIRALYNPAGQLISDIILAAQLSDESLPGTYRLLLVWGTPTTWEFGGVTHRWEGPYDGTYTFVLGFHKGQTAYRGQTITRLQITAA